MNVLRNSLRAVPGQSFAKTNDDNDNDGATTNPESVETEQYSQPEETVAPADQGSAAPDADPGSGDDNHDSSDSGADAAA